MKRWIIRQWNLRSRQFAAWRQKQYLRAINFYATEKAIWMLRGRRVGKPSASAKIAKPSRQLHRAIGRKFKKLNQQMEKRK
jgi:hypothetical protein